MQLQQVSSTVSTISVLLLSLTLITAIFSSVLVVTAYDPYDTYGGNITVRWDVMTWTPDGYVAVINITNNQIYRTVEKPGWKLGWTWSRREVIWALFGAQAIDQGDCSRFKGNIPYSCAKRPTIQDLQAGVPLNQQVTGCCRGGILHSRYQDLDKSTAGFQISVGAAGTTNRTVRLPRNFTFVADRGVYRCGPAKVVVPTRFISPDLRRVTRALSELIIIFFSSLTLVKTPTCCVSISSINNQRKTAKCHTCACNCRNETCNTRRKGDPGLVPPLMKCSDHMCPVSINWQMLMPKKNGGDWAAKVSITNFNYRINYSDWTLLVDHPAVNKLTKVLHANHRRLPSKTGEVMWGIKDDNDVITKSGSKGSKASIRPGYIYIYAGLITMSSRGKQLIDHSTIAMGINSRSSISPIFILLSLTAIIFSSSVVVVTTTHAFDIYDPTGNITIQWDVMSWTPDGYVALINITNNQMYRTVPKPGWKLSWTWAGPEVIWSTFGSRVINRGDCSSRFKAKGKGKGPHSCAKGPTIVDLTADAPFNQQIAGCCRGGILSSRYQELDKSTAGFQISVGDAGTSNSTVRLPRNFTFVAGSGGYTCGPARVVAPTRFTTPDGLRYTSALMTWNLVCTYSAFLASKSITCCVSLSSFDRRKRASCPTCSCNCRNSTCNTRSKGNPGFVPPLMKCSDHMCPVSINWQMLMPQKNGGDWAARVSITNYNYRTNYSDWTLLVDHPAVNKLTKVLHANHRRLPSKTLELMWGIEKDNDVITTSGSKSSKVNVKPLEDLTYFKTQFPALFQVPTQKSVLFFHSRSNHNLFGPEEAQD
ncbi:COBRA [Macleaya cordata]|uniref:COBRA n=1 Tax=Macleaya cordata TaxID=56857 RepID=A0A200R424_MACCD|nr:COBRA [Macleaya cordata]